MNVPINPQDLVFGLAPLVIAGLVRPYWAPWAKFLAALAVCAAAAVLQTALAGQFDFHSLGAAAAKIFLLVMTTYAVIWKKFQPASDLLDAIEKNINGGSITGGKVERPAEWPDPPPKSGPGEFPDLDAGGPGVGP